MSEFFGSRYPSNENIIDEESLSSKRRYYGHIQSDIMEQPKIRKGQIEGSIALSALSLSFLAPTVSVVAIEAPEGGDLTEEDKQTAASIVNRVTETPDKFTILPYLANEQTVNFAGQLKLTKRASLSPDVWRTDFKDVLSRSASIVPNQDTLIYEVVGGSYALPPAEDAIKSALEYLSQRPAGPAPQAQ